MREALEDAATPVRYAEGETIQQRGDRKPGLSIVAQGAVRLSATDADGRSTTIAIFRRGDSFGEMTLFLDIPRSLDATAVGDTVIAQLSRERFRQVLDGHPDLRDHLLAGLARQLSQTLEALDDQRRLPPVVRLAKTLLDNAEEIDGQYMAKGSQESLAEAIATSRVTVGKALAELIAEGLVESGYGRVVIPDPDRLRRWIGDRSALTPITGEPQHRFG